MWLYCVGLLSVAVVSTTSKKQKQFEEERVDLSYISGSQFIFEESQAGIWNQAPQRNASSSLVHWVILTQLSYRATNHQPRDDATHNGLLPLTSVTNQVCLFQRHPLVPLIGTIFQLFFSFQVISKNGKLTIKIIQHSRLSGHSLIKLVTEYQGIAVMGMTTVFSKKTVKTIGYLSQKI